LTAPFAERSANTAPPMFKLSSLLSEYEADAAAAHDAYRNGTPRGALTGIKRLDAELGGALAPGVTILHGGTGVGKTAFALHLAAECQCSCVYISSEMGRLELFRRLVARTTGVFLRRLKSGEIAPAESLALAKRTAAAVPNLVIVDATQVHAAPAWIREAGEVARGESRHLLLIVDSVHSWAESSPADLASEYEVLNAALVALRMLAHQLDCSVLGIAERNRAGVKGGLSAGAGSRKLEYGCEALLELDRDDNAGEDAAGEVPVTLKLSKNRHGSPGRKIDLLFSGAMQRWREA
jgi:replicative DNA helicase